MPNSFKDITGKELKALRERLGLTQVLMADLLCVNKGSIQNWETKGGNPIGPAKILINMLNQKPEIVLDFMKGIE